MSYDYVSRKCEICGRIFARRSKDSGWRCPECRTNGRKSSDELSGANFSWGSSPQKASAQKYVTVRNHGGARRGA